MKRLSAIVIALCAMVHTAWAYDFSATSPSGHTLYYEIISGTTNVGVVRPGTGSAYFNYVTGNVVIPATVVYNNTTYNVTELRSGTFEACYVTSVTIPNSVTSIGMSAFRDCIGLTSVTIPNSVTSIGEWAFDGCSGLTSVTIPNSVTSIGGWAFNGCSGLTSVTIPNSVTYIGEYAFASCSGLTTLNFNAINCGDFSNSYHHPFYNCPIATINIGDSVQRIPASFADNLESLTSVTIPNSVTSIGWAAFADCSSLTSVTIGNSVTSIGDYAFYDCSGLTTLNFNAINCGDFSSSYHPFYNCPITTINIGDSVQHIPAYFAYNLDSLLSVIIPNSVTSIGSSAFSGCSGLTSVTIPNSVTSIEDSAFIGCNNLYEVISLAILPPQLGEDIFPTTYMLKVPCGSANYYNSAASGWTQYFVEIEEICNVTITVTSANESMGTVSGGGEYEVGTEITITATPNQGYRFVSWNDGNTDNPRTITVTEDATYIASFEESVGIESRDMLSELAFYPNPTSGIITFNRNDIMKVEVLDAMGKMVAEFENSYVIDLSNLSKGYYALRITTPHGVAVRKVIRN